MKGLFIPVIISLPLSVLAQDVDDLVSILAGDLSDSGRTWIARENPFVIDLSVGTECKQGEKQHYSRDGKVTITSCSEKKAKKQVMSWTVTYENGHAFIYIDDQEYLLNPYRDLEVPENIYLELISTSETSDRPFKYHQLVFSEL